MSGISCARNEMIGGNGRNSRLWPDIYYEHTTHKFFVTRMSLNSFLHIPIVKDDTMRLVCVIINIFLAGSIFRLF